MEDDIPEIWEGEVQDREACLACEDKFDLLNETEKKNKKESNIQTEKDTRALIPSGNNYEWSWIAAQARLTPAKP